MEKPFLRISRFSVIYIILIHYCCNEPYLALPRVDTELNTGESRKIKLSNADLVNITLLIFKKFSSGK
jgi:hypothetical protein